MGDVSSTCRPREEDVRDELREELDQLLDRNRELQQERAELVEALSETQQQLEPVDRSFPPEWVRRGGLSTADAFEALESLVVRERQAKKQLERTLSETEEVNAQLRSESSALQRLADGLQKKCDTLAGTVEELRRPPDTSEAGIQHTPATQDAQVTCAPSVRDFSVQGCVTTSECDTNTEETVSTCDVSLSPVSRQRSYSSSIAATAAERRRSLGLFDREKLEQRAAAMQQKRLLQRSISPGVVYTEYAEQGIPVSPLMGLKLQRSFSATLPGKGLARIPSGRQLRSFIETKSP